MDLTKSQTLCGKLIHRCESISASNNMYAIDYNNIIIKKHNDVAKCFLCTLTYYMYRQDKNKAERVVTGRLTG